MKKILVAIDGSEHAWKALDLATDFAELYDAELILLHVLPYEPMPTALYSFAEIEHLPVEEERARFLHAKTLGDALTREAESRVRARGVTKVRGRTAEGRPANAIVEAAREEDVDMIVLGSRGLSEPKALFLGSVSHKVASQADRTCVVVK